MSFTIYFIICTIIAGIYFATLIAMDVTGKGQKKKESVEEFNTESMSDEGSVVIQETSPDGKYNVVKDDNDPSNIDLQDDGHQQKFEQNHTSGADSEENYSEQGNTDEQCAEGSEHENENSEENHEDDASATTEQQQNDNHDAAQEYLKLVNNGISTKCDAVDYSYQEFLESGRYDSVMSERSKQHNIKIINEVDKI